MVATEPVSPLGPPSPVGDLLGLHEEAGIELRVVRNLWPFVDAAAAARSGSAGSGCGTRSYRRANYSGDVSRGTGGRCAPRVSHSCVVSRGTAAG
ncbi:DUF6886 family protein [Amycolatopsis pretoriensis]